MDLPNVVTHEAGHLLGLSHSATLGSTMECSASPSDTDKRSLEQDDRDGLCAIYPPGVAFEDARYIGGKWASLRRTERASCSLRAAREGDAAWVWLLPIVLLTWRRRRG